MIVINKREGDAMGGNFSQQALEGTEMPLSAAGRERAATRAIAAATIGTALEWFDFTLYGAVSATVLPKLFFPAMDPAAALLSSLATFSVGLAARPLGAIVCGHLGDKLGRARTMMITILIIMAHDDHDEVDGHQQDAPRTR